MRATQGILLFASAVLLMGCGENITARRAKAEIDIYEAVFRHELAHWPQGANTNCFVSIGWDDNKDPIAPPGEVIKRLNDLPLRIRGPAEAEIVKLARKDRTVFPESVRDKTTGASGWIQTVKIVEWLNDNEVVVEVSSWAGPLSGGGYKARVKKIDGKWSLDTSSTSDHWVS